RRQGDRHAVGRVGRDTGPRRGPSGRTRPADDGRRAPDRHRSRTARAHPLADTVHAQPERPRSAETVLRASGIRLRPGAGEIDLDLRAGEIVGLAGLEGKGQAVFLRALRGAGGVAGRVVRVTPTREVEIDSPWAAARAGIVYVPRERRDEAIFGALSIRENFTLPTVGRDTVAGLV